MIAMIMMLEYTHTHIHTEYVLLSLITRLYSITITVEVCQNNEINTFNKIRKNITSNIFEKCLQDTILISRQQKSCW
jgi:hypothetical protein